MIKLDAKTDLPEDLLTGVLTPPLPGAPDLLETFRLWWPPALGPTRVIPAPPATSRCGASRAAPGTSARHPNRVPDPTED
ncbi:hypothetical protein [Streptomyces scopuliridis]|uniref:hypothetical protein n=1 Tax=Streptomyces scopuliridis TaxID=452529 RepID=UPI0035DAE440